jgi:8-oxo-dGTP pyrophosphatase MutT (NUDIX family)
LDASTLILLRETRNNNPFEVLLMRRHRNQNSFGNAFVFPGGILEEEDCNPKLADYTVVTSVEEIKGLLNESSISDEKALGLLYAAIRETFEESGVILAVFKSGRNINFKDPKIRKRFAGYRIMVYQNKMSLSELAEEEKLVFSLNQLTPFAHWITPEPETARFDTRFFLAQMPLGQEPIHDAVEMTETLWTTPAEALKKQKADEILLMPPTLVILEEISRFSSLSELLGFASSHTIQTILPQVLSGGEGRVILLPHDPEYSIEEYKQPYRPKTTSRIVFVNGQANAIKFGE